MTRPGSLALHWLDRWMYSIMAYTSLLRLMKRHKPQPPDDIATLLFQSTRELLFNVVKHAGVDRATSGVDVFCGECGAAHSV